MNHKLWGSLTITALLISSLGTATSSYADQAHIYDADSAPDVSLAETESHPPASTHPIADPVTSSTVEVSKVGEYQSQEEVTQADAEAIAIIQPHTLFERQAATVYVSNLPVLTFLGSSAVQSSTAPQAPQATDSEVKIGSSQSDSSPGTIQPIAASNRTPSTADQTSDPLERASAIAARLNQFHQNGTDPATIMVRWEVERSRYVIQLSEEELVEINADNILPDTTGDTAQDALQATNRLRRLLGGAPPLNDIAGRPQPEVLQISLGPVRLQLRGLASWYGPGFNGNRSASGEVFNQNAMTAAHRTLPFGTQVRVTNLDTGQSVVVRINDRGPFSRGRIIDLSAGAARVIGLIGSGVAPVNLEVLDSNASASN
jgi:rare lipoprotein A